MRSDAIAPVTAPAIPAEFPVLASTDDAEQNGQTMDLTDGDLDLGEKIVALRFDNVLIAPGPKITRAYVAVRVEPDRQPRPPISRYFGAARDPDDTSRPHPTT
jgi:hypothetical protein